MSASGSVYVHMHVIMLYMLVFSKFLPSLCETLPKSDNEHVTVLLSL